MIRFKQINWTGRITANKGFGWFLITLDNGKETIAHKSEFVRI